MACWFKPKRTVTTEGNVRSKMRSRDRHIHIDKTQKDQNAALNCYMLYVRLQSLCNILLRLALEPSRVRASVGTARGTTRDFQKRKRSQCCNVEMLQSNRALWHNGFQLYIAANLSMTDEDPSDLSSSTYYLDTLYTFLHPDTPGITVCCLDSPVPFPRTYLGPFPSGAVHNT
jgi:hypothetical protein